MVRDGGWLQVAITGQTQSNSAVAFKRLQHDHPEVTANSSDFKFRGRGQRDTPVTDVRGIVEIIMLLPGQQTARVRRQAAELLVRYLGGDMRIIDEVCALRGLQEELATARPDDPRRIFGEAVEASGSHGPVGAQLVRIISTVERRLTAQESFVRNGLSIRTGFGITPKGPKPSADLGDRCGGGHYGPDPEQLSGGIQTPTTRPHRSHCILQWLQ